MKKIGFIPQLDSFRFFAAGMIVLLHWLPKLDFLPLGLGVTFFFVLSGYLISSNLLYAKQEVENKDLSLSDALKNFYIRRTLRIFPLYYFVLLLCYLFVRPLFEGKALWYFLYLGNWCIFKQQAWQGMLSHFWTLAIEEQFYLVWPFLILVLNKRWMMPLFIVMTAISISLKLFVHVPFLGILPCSQMDAFAVGAILAYGPFSKSGRSFLEKIPANWAMGIFLLLSLVVFFTPFAALNDIFMIFATPFIILRAKAGFKGLAGKVLDWKPLQYLGKISYGLYVYHNFIPWLWRCLNGTESRYPLPIHILYFPQLQKPVPTLVAETALLITIASLSWFLFERPLNNLKNLFRDEPRPSYALRS